MSAQAAPTGAPGPTAGQWRPTDPNRVRSSKQQKRDLRKDRGRRRRILERAQCDPTLTHTAVRVLGVLAKPSDDSAKPTDPFMASVAADIGIAKRSARRCVAELVEAGYVYRFMRPIAHEMNDSNKYYFRQPPGPPPRHRPGQRRRLRIRSSQWGTPKTAGTPEGGIQPSPPGAVTPGPPPRTLGSRRNPPSTASSNPHPKPFPPAPPPHPTSATPDTVATNALAAARTLLRPQIKPERP